MSNYTVSSYTYYNGYITITLSDGTQVGKTLAWFQECPNMSDPVVAIEALKYFLRVCRKRIEDKLNMESYFMDQHLRQLNHAEEERFQHEGFHTREY